MRFAPFLPLAQLLNAYKQDDSDHRNNVRSAGTCKLFPKLWIVGRIHILVRAATLFDKVQLQVPVVAVLDGTLDRFHAPLFCTRVVGAHTRPQTDPHVLDALLRLQMVIA